jgi:MFS family permease
MSSLAQNAVNFALVLLIVDETGLAFMSSLLVLALVVPSTLCGLIAGVTADRLPKRPQMMLGDMARAAVCYLFIASPGTPATYYIVAILMSVAGQFANTARGAAGPLVVERDELARANAIYQAVQGAAQLVGLGVVTPLLLRVFDSPHALFVVAGILFAAAAFQAVLMGRLRKVETREDLDAAEGFWSKGWRFMRRDPHVWRAAVELTLIATTLIILGGLIPAYIDDVLGLPVDVGALILSPAVVGVAAGLRVAAFLAHRLSHAFLSTVGFAAFVLLLAALTFVDQEAEFLAGYSAFSWLDSVDIGTFDGAGVLAMAVMLPLGFAYAVVSVAAQTVIHDLVPLQLQGQVGAAQNAMAAVASSVPVLLAGLLADAVGVVTVMAIVATAIGAAAVANLRSPHARLQA